MDPLGRVVWGLDVAGDSGLWVDHRSHTYCRLDGPLDLAFLPLGPLSLSALPPLLLGRLPAPPADPASAAPGTSAAPETRAAPGGTLSYRDTAGRRWSAALRDGQVVSWGVWQDEAAGPILSWVSNGGWAVLSDRRKGVQVRWREALREPLRRMAPLSPPGEYRETTCARSR